MTTKNFNAKKVLMSTVAAVVFSFVFTTSANANCPENSQKANLEVRVKGSANGDKNNVGIRVKGSANDGKNNVGIRVKGSANDNKDNVGIRVKGSQQNTEDNFVSSLLQTFGVRVKLPASIYKIITEGNIWQTSTSGVCRCYVKLVSVPGVSVVGY